MKFFRQTLRTTLLISAAAILVVSCKKNKPEPETPGDTQGNTPTGTLFMHLHTYIGINEVDAYNIVYTSEADRQISLSLAQMYISDIELVKADGSIYSLGNTKFLKLFETETYLLADVPVGNYKSVRFKVGLDASTNAADPSVNESLLNRPEMWLGATAQPDGYVFMNAQGKIDTTADGMGPIAQMQNFTLKIGTNAHYKQVIMPDKNFTMLEGQAEYVHLYADYSKLFSGIDLHQVLSVTSVADNGSALSNALTNNIANMFVYE